MNRTLNKELVKRLRTQKGWSQEELAIAADLSPRTIQRLEANGRASTNSVKSIASVLEVNMHNLEEKPRTNLIGVRWGYGGVFVGATSATIAIIANWIGGGGSAYETGVSMGIVGLVTGVSCAFIGWASARF